MKDPAASTVYVLEDQRPPSPLLGANESYIGFREGANVELRHEREPKSLFLYCLTGTLMLDGQPVRCTGFAPGLSLRTSIPQAAVFHQLEAFVIETWAQVAPVFQRWQAINPRPAGVTIDVAGVRVEIAQDAELGLKPGVMQITQVHGGREGRPSTGA